MGDIQKLVRIQLGVIAAFIFIKFIVRPAVVSGDYWSALQVFVLSFPNLCEAIIGTLTLTYIGLYLNTRNIIPGIKMKALVIYLLATILAGIYVILQEFKIHNLGGKNVYDPYDVLFSIFGLMIGYLLLVLLKPRIRMASDPG